MIVEAFMQVLVSFLGSLGFAMLYNLHGKKLWAAGFGGLISWLAYLMMEQGSYNNFLNFMYAAIVATIYAEVMARKLKTPATVYLISSIIPLVPGGNLYYTMNYMIGKNWELSRFYGEKAIITAAAVAAGIMMASSLYSIVIKIKWYYDKKRRI
jgi:uncharacterized membrane protein YjjB (DUF3815 family)